MTNVEIYAQEVLSRSPGNEIVGAEIGVEKGIMSAALLRDPRLVHLHMVDSWASPEDQPEPYVASGDFHAKLSLERQECNMIDAETNTEFARGRRTILRLPSVKAAGLIPDASLDFVFIDADHSYEGCRDDIRSWLPKVRPGGILSGHDYARPGTEACPNSATEGVTVAVDEAVAEFGWTLELGRDFTWFVRL